MITGRVNASHEGVVRVEVIGRPGRSAVVEAVVDTGFTGHLILPQTEIDALGLESVGFGEAVLGDGQVISFSTYQAVARWDGQEREVKVNPTSGVPLVGLRLLQGFRFQMDVIEGGTVRIERLP